MSAPLPLTGTNPYTLGYQKRQFGTGHLNPTPHHIFDDLVSPPTAGVTAEGQTPLVEEKEFFDLTPQTVTVYGAPSTFSFVLAYEGIPTTAFTQATTTGAMQTALQLVSTIGSGNATVAGSTGGPWVITLLMTAPLSLLTVEQASFTGGTDPSIVVTSPAQQPGIIPY